MSLLRDNRFGYQNLYVGNLEVDSLTAVAAVVHSLTVTSATFTDLHVTGTLTVDGIATFNADVDVLGNIEIKDVTGTTTHVLIDYSPTQARFLNAVSMDGISFYDAGGGLIESTGKSFYFNIGTAWFSDNVDIGGTLNVDGLASLYATGTTDTELRFYHDALQKGKAWYDESAGRVCLTGASDYGYFANDDSNQEVYAPTRSFSINTVNTFANSNLYVTGQSEFEDDVSIDTDAATNRLLTFSENGVDQAYLIYRPTLSRFDIQYGTSQMLWSATTVLFTNSSLWEFRDPVKVLNGTSFTVETNNGSDALIDMRATSTGKAKIRWSHAGVTEAYMQWSNANSRLELSNNASTWIYMWDIGGFDIDVGEAGRDIRLITSGTGVVDVQTSMDVSDDLTVTGTISGGAYRLDQVPSFDMYFRYYDSGGTNRANLWFYDSGSSGNTDSFIIDEKYSGSRLRMYESGTIELISGTANKNINLAVSGTGKVDVQGPLEVDETLDVTGVSNFTDDMFLIDEDATFTIRNNTGGTTHYAACRIWNVAADGARVNNGDAVLQLGGKGGGSPYVPETGYYMGLDGDTGLGSTGGFQPDLVWGFGGSWALPGSNDQLRLTYDGNFSVEAGDFDVKSLLKLSIDGSDNATIEHVTSGDKITFDALGDMDIDASGNWMYLFADSLRVRAPETEFDSTGANTIVSIDSQTGYSSTLNLQQATSTKGGIRYSHTNSRNEIFGGSSWAITEDLEVDKTDPQIYWDDSAGRRARVGIREASTEARYQSMTSNDYVALSLTTNNNKLYGATNDWDVTGITTFEDQVLAEDDIISYDGSTNNLDANLATISVLSSSATLISEQVDGFAVPTGYIFKGWIKFTPVASKTPRFQFTIPSSGGPGDCWERGITVSATGYTMTFLNEGSILESSRATAEQYCFSNVSRQITLGTVTFQFTVLSTTILIFDIFIPTTT